MDTPWRDAIIRVLKASASAMHYAEIAEAIMAQKLRQSVGATPASTVIATITSDLKKNGNSSVFLRVKPGEYMLRAGAPASAEGFSVAEAEGEEEAQPQPLAGEELGIIQAFGMFWRRDLVLWTGTPRVLGVQQQGAQTVDFTPQIGVYLLHDGREVVYVGRAIDRPLGKRLFEHTSDRLNGRWDRFSWFGLRRVTPDGKLVKPDWNSLKEEQLIATMEALLIEGLEPRQNRKRGDEFKAVEYLQIKDPGLKKQEMDKLLDEFRRKAERD